jgi:hypothetical protein
MEPEVSLQSSQEPVTGHYESSPYPHPISLRSILISFHLRPGLPHSLFPSDHPTKTIYTLPFHAFYMLC